MRDGPPLDGRVALVTGASRGIGRAVALRLAADGAACAVGYARSIEAAAAVVDQIRAAGGRAIAVDGDVGDEAAVEHIVDLVTGELGGIDILVANAGIGDVSRPTAQVPLDSWDEVIRVNLRSAFLTSRAVVPGMVERGFGRIVLMSSVAAFTGGMIGPHYAASKAGLIGLAHWLAAELAGDGVTVNVIAPALVESDMMPPVPERRRELAARVPVGRLGTPEEVADLTSAVVRNGYMTNQVVLLDGGIHPH